MERFNFVRDMDEVRKLFLRFSNHHSLVFHTVISKKLKIGIDRLSRTKGIPVFDLTGPPTEFMARHLHMRPDWNVGAVHPIDESYEHRVSAIEFAIEHDDGAGGQTLRKADVILVGPSRCSKTPTSMYLAVKGYFVANIPLIREIPPSEDLLALAGDPRVIGFVIAPEKLYEVRKKRASELGTQAGSYTDLRAIDKELEWARGICRRQRWQTIDITDRAIEETAALIIRKLQKNGHHPAS